MTCESKYRHIFSLSPAHSEGGEAASWHPLADIYRTNEGWLIKYDLAGVLPEDVKLACDGRRLTLSGTRRDCAVEAGYRQYQLEISYCRFERTLEFPESIEPGEVTLTYWHGFLLVRITKEPCDER